MKIYTNKKLIKKNKKIGQITTFAAMLVLGGGLFMSFKPDLLYWSFGALIVGFLASQIGIYFTSRWGRVPPLDEELNSFLKGIPGNNAIYHYMTSVPHLLVGPSGVWALLPYAQGGHITFDETKRRWRQKGGNWYLKFFGQESLGRVDLEVDAALKDTESLLNSILGDEAEKIEPQVVLVFVNPKTTVDAENADTPTLVAAKLKDFFRKSGKSKLLDVETVTMLQQALPTESIE
jgi:hypothetical protein